MLIIDDSPSDVYLTRQALAEEPYPVHCHVAPDGAEALRLLSERSFHPDLIILDLDMPRVSGLVLLERYRPVCPVVVFSSSENLADRHRALELGAREFVQKPRHFRSQTR